MHSLLLSRGWLVGLFEFFPDSGSDKEAHFNMVLSTVPLKITGARACMALCGWVT